MVDESGNARITDFGLATIARDSNSLTNNSNDQGNTIRWSAPEVLGSDKAVIKESDVFSFGMVIIEVGGDRSTGHQPPHSLMKVFTGEVPFKGTKASEVVMRVTSGKRPGRPNHPKFTNPLWELTRRCWTEAVQDRPKMEEVTKALKKLSAFYFAFTRRTFHPHPLRSVGEVEETLPTPSGESPAVVARPQTTISRKPSARGMPPGTSVGGGGGTTPYEVDTQPEPIPRPPPKDGTIGHSTHEVIQGVTGGTTKRSSSRRTRGARGAFPCFPTLVRNRSINRQRFIRERLCDPGCEWTRATEEREGG